jgi:predicted nucleotidyltransferase
MKVKAPSLAPILRSDTQGRVLARLFADPTKAYSLSELVRWAASSMPTVQREMQRAAAATIVTSEKVGPTRLVRANTENPLFDPLRKILLATYGPPAVVASDFKDVERVHAVLIFGSWAARYLGESGRAPNDVDVLVIGRPDRDSVDAAAERAEKALGIPVQATVRSLPQWNAGREAFLQQVKSRPFVVVLADGELEDLASGDQGRQ